MQNKKPQDSAKEEQPKSRASKLFGDFSFHQKNFEKMFVTLGPKKTLKRLQENVDEIKAMPNLMDKMMQLSIVQANCELLEKHTYNYLDKKIQNKTWWMDLACSGIGGALIVTPFCLVGLAVGIPAIGFAGMVAGVLTPSRFMKPKFVKNIQEKKYEKNADKVMDKWSYFFHDIEDLENSISNLQHVIGTDDNARFKDDIKKKYEKKIAPKFGENATKGASNTNDETPPKKGPQLPPPSAN